MSCRHCKIALCVVKEGGKEGLLLSEIKENTLKMICAWLAII